MTWFLDLVRQLLSVFDRIVYGLIEVFYTAFNLIAKTRVFQSGVIEQFATRVYVFLALIMLFKISFSIIQYIINPDNFTNNEKGIGKLIQNVIIVMVLVVITPTIFEQAYNLQRIVLKENIVGQIILGKSQSNMINDEDVHRTMSFSVLSAFLKPNEKEIPALSSDDFGNTVCTMNGQEYAMPTIEEIKRNGTSGIGYINDNLGFVKCMNNLSTQQANIIDDNKESHPGIGMGATYVWAQQKQDYQLLINLITAKYVDDPDIYLFQYTYVISTIAGGFIAWIFLIFCFDVAVRSVKLGFLQIIAPIPIISYVDPKSSKSGMFQKWLKSCLSTYADLFIRLIAIYFAIYIIKIVSDSSQLSYWYGDGEPNAIIHVFIIVGALMFAKQVPKLIEDITGIKLSGKFELNPLKKFEDNALGGKRITSAAAGLVTGGIAGAVAGHGIGRVGRFISGGLGGAGRGFVSGQGIRATRDNLTRGRHAMEIANANGSTFGGRMRLRAENAIGLDNELDRINRQEDELTREEAQIANNQAAQRAIMSGNTKISDTIKKMEDRARERIINGQAGADSDTYLRRQEEINNLKSQRDAANAAGNTARANALTSQIVSETQRLNDWLEDDAINNYIDSGADGVINGMVNDYNELCRIYHETAYTTAHDRHDHNRILRTANSDIERGFMDDQRRVDEIKEEKRELAEEKRVAQANMDAVSSRPPHGGGGRPH